MHFRESLPSGAISVLRDSALPRFNIIGERRGVAAAARLVVRRPQGSGMPALAQALVAVALVSTAIVAAAPTVSSSRLSTTVLIS